MAIDLCILFDININNKYDLQLGVNILIGIIGFFIRCECNNLLIAIIYIIIYIGEGLPNNYNIVVN